MERQLIFCGDIHGEFKELIFTAVEKYKLKTADIVVLGDFGLGFDKSIKNQYEKESRRLEKNDLMIYSIRGNHDNPSLFDSDIFNFPRLKFWKDHELYELCGRKIYTIGGACSTDIKYRKDWNEKHPGKEIWWPEEDIIRQPLSEIPKRVDIIISHDAPISFEPIATRLDETPVEQYKKIIDAREYLEDIKNNINTDYWFFGHHHKSYSGSFGNGSLYRGLGIMELFECPERKIYHNPQGEIKENEKTN